MIRTTIAALALVSPLAGCSAPTTDKPAVQQAIPAAVVVAFDGDSVTPLIAEGVRNFETNEPVEYNDPVRIASISKLIMALAVLRLVDEGKVDLDRDVSDYLGFEVRSPNFPDSRVTLAQLMSHRAGLRDKAGYIIPLGESLAAKLADPESWYADAPPGEAPFEYANLGSPVVATVLEAATGERYDRLLERTVFAPLEIEACVNWIGCSDEMVSRAVALYRDTGEPARDYPSDLPPQCSIPVAEGVECSLENYVPGTNASIFSPQGGVRIGMLDLAKIGQALIAAEQKQAGIVSAKAMQTMATSILRSDTGDQEFFCTYGLHVQLINLPERECLDMLFAGEEGYYGHSGQAYGLESGLWMVAGGDTGFAFFRTQAPPPAGGEDTGGFTQGEKDLLKRAQQQLAKQVGG